MTTKEKIKALLVDRGMFDSQAEQVLAIAIPKMEEVMPGRITWERPSEEYPDQIYTLLWMQVKGIAKEWIAENKPEAWYRPMFD